MKRVFGLVIVFLLSLGVVFAASTSDFVNASFELTNGPINYACADLSNYPQVVFGNVANSSEGYGAVDICGYCYLCGVADGVCPEDFYSNSLQGSCSEFQDPDCTGCISGTAQVNLTGIGLVTATNAQVNVYYDAPHLASRSGPVSSTNGGVVNSVGGFNATIIAGANASIQLIYDADGPNGNDPLSIYASPLISVDAADVARAASCYDLNNVVLQLAPCQADCTREGTDTCDASCDGVNGCSFSSGSGFVSTAVAAKSDGKQIGDYVVVESVTSGTCMETEYYTYACTGPIQNTTQYNLNCGATSGADESILNLVTRVHRIWYDGTSGAKPVELVIMHWDEEIN